MTTTEKVHELIRKAKKGKLAPEALKPGATLQDDLGLDSLAMVELLV
jgi:acyl carrier protein